MNSSIARLSYRAVPALVAAALLAGCTDSGRSGEAAPATGTRCATDAR